MKYSFDSFKLRFPLDEVDVINQTLLSSKVRTITDLDTGEILREEQFKSKSLQADFDHYNIHFAISETFNRTELIILVNSKLLEGAYMDGIAMHNIELVYNRLMSANIVYMDFNTFLGGLVSDLDIKQDTLIDSVELFEECTLDMERFSIAKKKSGHGVNRINQSTNKGIEWNTRKNATPSNPFLKIYHKGIESRNGKNASFFQYYNIPISSNSVRIEATIKNKSHFKKYGIESTRLVHLLGLDNEVYRKVIEDVLQRNLQPRNLQPKKPRNSLPMTIQETMLFTLMSGCVTSMKMTKEETIQYTIANFSDKHRKHRAKKKAQSIYEQYIEGENYQQKVEKGSNFFRIIGWK